MLGPLIQRMVLTAPLSIAWRAIMFAPELVSAGHRAMSCLFKSGRAEAADFEQDDTSASNARIKQCAWRKVIVGGYRSPGLRTSR